MTVDGAADRNATAAPASTTEPNIAKNIFIIFNVQTLLDVIGGIGRLSAS
jgi:hypothetical protein